MHNENWFLLSITHTVYSACPKNLVYGSRNTFLSAWLSSYNNEALRLLTRNFWQNRELAQFWKSLLGRALIRVPWNAYDSNRISLLIWYWTLLQVEKVLPWITRMRQIKWDLYSTPILKILPYLRYKWKRRVLSHAAAKRLAWSSDSVTHFFSLLHQDICELTWFALLRVSFFSIFLKCKLSTRNGR